ncbi:hypothetical protein MNEG_9020 [Monoraphidium neglectum]|uniref:Protein kinase domain-containing protein n=1 Tax=Monoraphidium neglectum TaxID=145388 RepID=A0A0D2MXI0_9CHLO|nr:hypothetical protein MNEG_9020 [Monoraphidium neglectum]KIY98940.1 hypothetical protein MNEG_9020 [Monoraphidium neglectum]|eukprot:XP_013897960.1 hypothetical protein MNEG_9020 [Monoraphidium neglectum]
MHSGGNDQAKAVAHAMEMAVLSSVQHPSIVQAYACLPDMARLPDDTRSPAPTLTFRGLLPGEDAHGAAACDVLIMELCDRGTLRDALAAGALPAGPAAGAPWGVAVLLLDVAAGLHYLHSIGLAHGGVEAENVLLKTSADRDGPGVQAKLGGFGKARILPRLGGRGDPLEALSLAGGASHSTLVGADSAGSDGGLLSDGLVVVTASPGNCARCCSGGTPAASFAGDVYAFGALLLQTLDTCRGVLGPTSGPTRCAYSALAADCMAPAASFRPTMAAVAARLEAMA